MLQLYSIVSGKWRSTENLDGAKGALSILANTLQERDNTFSIITVY